MLFWIHVLLDICLFCIGGDTARDKYEEDIHANKVTIRLVFGDPGGKTINGAINVARKTLRNSYLTGSAGIEAALDLMKANIARKEASEGLCLLK